MPTCVHYKLPAVPAWHPRVKAVANSRLQHTQLARARHGLNAAQASANNATVATTLSVDIPTTDARRSLRFQAVRCGTGQAIVVSAVADGSSAEQAGVQRGMKLTGISDPVRRDEVWELQDRPSLRYIRDVLRMRSSGFITLRFETAADLLDALEASEGSVRLTHSNSSGSSTTPQSSIDTLGSLASVSDSEGGTVAEKLQQQYELAQQGQKGVTAVEQRQQRRKSYMEQVGQRNDSGFFGILFASFLLPAVVILGVAYGTGYLDNLYDQSLTNMR